MRFLMPPHSLTNFEIEKYYQNEPPFDGVHSRNNQQEKIKDEIFVINLDEYADAEFIENKNIKANNFQVQANNSVMCEYFCIGFIDFILACRKLTYFTSLFSPMTLKRTTR